MDYYYTSESTHPASRWRNDNYPVDSQPDLHYRQKSSGDRWPGSVEQHSRNIIEQIARERSLSPDHKPSANRFPSSYRQHSATPSPPPRPVPPMKPLRSICRTSPDRLQQGSSVITIPSRSSLAHNSEYDRRYVGSRQRIDSDLAPPGSSYQHRERTLTQSSGGDSSRSANNVIRLSVSGDHGSSNNNSYRYKTGMKGSDHYPLTDESDRRSYRNSFSHQRNSPNNRATDSTDRLSSWRKNHNPDYFDRRSLSSSPERNVYHHIVQEEYPGSPDYKSKETQYWDRTKEYDKEHVRNGGEHFNSSSEQYTHHTPEHRLSVSGNNQRSNGHIHNSANIHERDGRSRVDAPEKKRKIRIKFTYDDTNDEPSDVRLSKYKEYQGKNGNHIPQITQSSGKNSEPSARSPERHSRVFFEDDSPHRDSQERNWQSYSKYDGKTKSGVDQTINNHRRLPKSEGDEGTSSTGRSPSPRLHHPLKYHHSAAETSHADDQIQIGSSIRDDGGYRVYKMDLPDNAASSPEQNIAPKKKNWLSSTLSRLDLRSRKGRRSKSPSRQRGSSETRGDAPSKPSAATVDGSDRSRELSLTRNGRNYVYVAGGSSRSEFDRERQRARDHPADQHQGRPQGYNQREEHHTVPMNDSRLNRSDPEQAFGMNRHRSTAELSQSTMELSDPKLRQRGRSHTASAGSGSGSSRQARRPLHSLSLENVNSASHGRLQHCDTTHRRLSDNSRTVPAQSRATRHRNAVKDSARTSYARSASSRDLSDSSTRRTRDDSPAVPIRYSAGTSNSAAVRLHNTHHSNHQPHRHQSSKQLGTRSTGIGRVSSEQHSSESESPNRAAASASLGSGSNRSVYLHATTVADIPAPDQSDLPENSNNSNKQHQHRSRSGSRLSNDSGLSRQPLDPQRLPNKERRRVARSFSLMGPFRPRHRTNSSSAGEITYENNTGLASGRPPRHPHRSASRSKPERDRSSNSSHAGGSGAASATLASSDDSSPHSRRQVSRSVSMPRGPASTSAWRRPTR